MKTPSKKEPLTKSNELTITKLTPNLKDLKITTPKSVKKKSEPRTPSSLNSKLDVNASTPNQLSLRRNLFLTPSMKERTLPVSKAATPLQKAREKLHVSAVPKSMTCREKEFNNIYSFLKSKIIEKSSGLVESNNLIFSFGVKFLKSARLKWRYLIYRLVNT